jgi:hypothetical protein
LTKFTEKDKVYSAGSLCEQCGKSNTYIAAGPSPRTQKWERAERRTIDAIQFVPEVRLLHPGTRGSDFSPTRRRYGRRSNFCTVSSTASTSVFASEPYATGGIEVVQVPISSGTS